MDVASIRIQFMTLAKTIHRNKSICHLEVIPNVTNVENMDKIEWKSENNKTEYILPINYRIIFRKVEPTDIEESHKIYYSCVDLLHTHVNSINKVELGSGDVSRIVSDTNLAQNFTTIQGEANEKLDKKTKQNMTNECAQNLKKKILEETDGYSRKAATVMLEICKEKRVRERSFVYLHDDVFDKHSNIISENNTARKTTSVQIEISKEKLKDKKAERTVSEKFYACETNIMKPVSVETLTDLNAKLENGSKLKMTSIISEQDTKLRPLLRTVYQNTSFCNTPEQISDATNNDTEKQNMKDFQQNTIRDSRNAVTRKSCTVNTLSPVISRFCSEYKITSALRLSNFKQLIELEMLPLIITLDEIIYKCIMLGLSLNCQNHETESYDPQDSIIQKCYRQLQPSNRGVYSVVYNK